MTGIWNHFGRLFVDALSCFDAVGRGHHREALGVQPRCEHGQRVRIVVAYEDGSAAIVAQAKRQHLGLEGLIDCFITPWTKREVCLPTRRCRDDHEGDVIDHFFAVPTRLRIAGLGRHYRRLLATGFGFSGGCPDGAPECTMHQPGSI
jgi:hypothetical protein